MHLNRDSHGSEGQVHFEGGINQFGNIDVVVEFLDVPICCNWGFVFKSGQLVKAGPVQGCSKGRGTLAGGVPKCSERINLINQVVTNKLHEDHVKNRCDCNGSLAPCWFGHQPY